MPTLPDVQDLGPRPTPISNRQLATVRNAGAVGEAVADFGGKASHVVQQIEEMHDEDDVRRRDVEHMEAAREIRQRARQARGVNAEAARAAADEELRRLDERVIASARSRSSRDALSLLVRRRSAVERDGLAEHSLRETTAAMEGAIVARRDGYITEAEENWDNPEALESSLSSALAAVEDHGRWAGAAPEAIATERRQVAARVRGAVVEQRLAANDYDGAAEYLREHSGEVDHEREQRYWGVINGELELQQTDGDAAAAITGAAPAPTGQPPAEGSPAPVTASGAAGAVATSLRNGRVAGQQVSEAVVAGFLGNGEQESGWRQGRSGDGGTAHGYFQWRAERVANFQRIIGAHPSRATAEQTARFVLWEMNNPGAAGMTVQQRDAILAARTPEEAAELIDRHYERSDGNTRAVRSAAARRYYGGEAGASLPPADGRRVDLEAAYSWIDRQPWPERRQRLARAQVRQFAAQNAEVRGEQEDEARDLADRRIAELGEGFTNINQLPNSGANLNGAALRSYTELARNNRERAENREVSPELLLFINYTRFANPNYFTTPEFRQEVMRRGGTSSLLRTVATAQGTALGQTAAQRAEQVADARLWAVADPLLRAMGMDFDATQTPDTNRTRDARQQERLEDVRRKNDVLEQLRGMSRIWTEAHPGQVPDDATLRGWVGNMVSSDGRIRITGDDNATARMMSPNDRRWAEQALRQNNMPINERNIAAAHRRRVALMTGRR